MSQRVIILGRRLAAIRRERYLTQDEFADELEMSAANVRRLEQAEAGGMQVKNFRRLAALLKVSPDELRLRIGAPGAMQASDADGTTEASDVRKKDPGLPPSAMTEAGPDVGSGVDSAGGRFPSALKPDTKTDVVDVAHFHGVSAARIEQRGDARRGRAPAPAGSPRRFAVTVDGDCMEPKYRDGDIVVFSVDAAEREGIIDGKNYFLQFADGENTFKRVFLDPDNRELLSLRCWNPRYADRVIERSRIKLVARAIFRLLPDE